MSEKKRRLFVRLPGTKGNFVYCGGPDVNDMVNQVDALLQSCAEPLVERALEDIEFLRTVKPGFLARLWYWMRWIKSEPIYADYVMVRIVMMTDEETVQLSPHNYTETPMGVRSDVLSEEYLEQVRNEWKK